MTARRAAEAQLSLAVVAACNKELEVSKQLLFRAVAEPKHCPRALVVMAALGLVQRDGVLAAAALGMMQLWNIYFVL